MLESSPQTIGIIFVSMIIIIIAVTLPMYLIDRLVTDTRVIKKRLYVEEGGDGVSPLIPTVKSLEKFGDLVTPDDTKEASDLRSDLNKAGYFDPAAVKVFFAARLISLLISIIIFAVFFTTFRAKLDQILFLFISSVILLAGFYGPKIFLGRRKAKRRLQMANGFPDMTDLLVACLEAGLGLNAALLRVSEELETRYPALKTNIDLLNMELRAGRERHKAMYNFADRADFQEAKAMVTMLRQSEEMGSSLGIALRAFSEEMRHKRMMSAEEKAMALPAKLTVPLILFIFPAILVLLLLPASIRIMAGLQV